MDNLTLTKAADDRLDTARGDRLKKTADPSEPPTEGFIAGMSGELYAIQTTQGIYYARMLSTGSAPLGGKVSLMVTSQGIATCNVMPA